MSCILSAASLAGMQQEKDLIRSLHFSAQSDDHFLDTCELINNGADVNAKDKFSNTPLMVATQALQLKTVEFLLSQEGIDVNHANSVGSTALMWAAETCFNPTCEALIEALLYIPNATQKERIIAWLGMNKCRNELNFLGLGPNFARTFKPHLCTAIYDQNKQNFEQSVACQEVNKIPYRLVKQHILEKYSNKPDAIPEDNTKQNGESNEKVN